jgi:hypothetical protein
MATLLPLELNADVRIVVLFNFHGNEAASKGKPGVFKAGAL